MKTSATLHPAFLRYCRSRGLPLAQTDMAHDAWQAGYQLGRRATKVAALRVARQARSELETLLEKAL